LLSQGVPMICGGDEIGRTQRGNNNAYAQDNRIGWYDWNLDDRKRCMLEFTRQLVQFRKTHPNLHRRKFFQDRSIGPGSTPEREVDGRREQDITWLRPDGEEMAAEEWNAGWIRCIGLQLSGRTLDDVNHVGEPIRDDTFLICLNPHHEPIKFYMPRRHGTAWEVLIDTNVPEGLETRLIVHAGEPYELAPRCTTLLRELND